MLPGAGGALLAGVITLLGVGGGAAGEDVAAAKGGNAAETLVGKAAEVESDSAVEVTGVVGGLSLASWVWRGAGFASAVAAEAAIVGDGALVVAATLTAGGADCQFRIWSGVIRSTTTSALPGPSIPSL